MDHWKSLWLFWVLFSAGAVAAAVGSIVEASWLVLAGVILILAAMAQYLIFYRCPSCGGHLGRGFPSYCPHCGEKLK